VGLHREIAVVPFEASADALELKSGGVDTASGLVA
jgi:hypothetical protein